MYRDPTYSDWLHKKKLGKRHPSERFSSICLTVRPSLPRRKAAQFWEPRSLIEWDTWAFHARAGVSRPTKAEAQLDSA
jgi:hypothetical protein